MISCMVSAAGCGMQGDSSLIRDTGSEWGTEAEQDAPGQTALEVSQTPKETKAAKATKTPSATVSPEPEATDSQSNENVDTSQHHKAAKDYEEIFIKGKVKEYGGTILIGDTGFELYTFIKSAARSYATVVNQMARELGEEVTVYDMVVPTSVGVTLPDDKIGKINSSDQKLSLRFLYKQLSEKVQGVELYDTLMEHRTEYIYYRTDHHWTAKGAYYGYQQFCQAKGIEANALQDYETDSFGNFRGSFYTDTKSHKLRADKMKVYYPLDNDKITMQYTDMSGNKHTSNVICDASNYSASLKYCTYIAGDNPYSHIRNRNIKDGSSCVVIKESFGNAMVPYLADHYEDIYVIDYRYWRGSICSLVKKKKIQDVLLINNISMTRNTYLIGKLAQIQ